MTGTTRNVYRRNISSEELSGGFILITKDALPMFPGIGRPISLRIGGDRFKTEIEAVSCSCVGPEKEHEHYHLMASQFRSRLPAKGRSPITIRRTSDGVYQLTLGA